MRLQSQSLRRLIEATNETGRYMPCETMGHLQNLRHYMAHTCCWNDFFCLCKSVAFRNMHAKEQEPQACLARLLLS